MRTNSPATRRVRDADGVCRKAISTRQRLVEFEFLAPLLGDAEAQSRGVDRAAAASQLAMRGGGPVEVAGTWAGRRFQAVLIGVRGERHLDGMGRVEDS